MAEILLQGISKSFGKHAALRDVSLTVPNGSFVVLLGPSGAGKTTTLRVVAGLERPETGNVLIDGQSVVDESPAQRDIAMVFQQYSLYPHMTVRENLSFPLRSPVHRLPEDQIKRKVHEVAEVLRISQKLDNKATASIGRALVRNPAIYLMDEPLSSLDAKLRADLRVELKSIQASLGATFLYVTHDQIEAMTMATHIGVLEQGRLIQFGSPRDIYERPASLDVASRLGIPRINTLPAELFGGAPAGARTIGLRPEHIQLGEGRPAKVGRIEHLGDQTRLHLNLDGHPIITLTDAHSNLSLGDTVAVKPVTPLYFDSAGLRLG
jgi:multiple sugar transport system ATP-binding protein